MVLYTTFSIIIPHKHLFVKIHGIGKRKYFLQGSCGRHGCYHNIIFAVVEALEGMVEPRYGTESYGNAAVGGEVADNLVVESCCGITVGEIICQRRHFDCHGQCVASWMMVALRQP